MELDRPTRAARRHGAKSDPLDADRAAREALGRDQLAQPRATVPRAALSVRLAARRSAVQAPTDAQRQLHALVIAAPRSCADGSDPLHPPAGGRLARLRIHADWDVRPPAPPPRCGAWPAESGSSLPRPPPTAKPSWPWCGPGGPTSSPARGRPDRGRHRAVRLVPPSPLPPDAAFAMLAAAPIPASSGQTVRVRLNRSGDRQLNQALYTMVLTTAPHRPSHPHLRRAPACPGQDRPRDQTLP